MSNYNDNWKAFVDETKEMSDEQLQEYVGDILNFARGLSSQSGQGGKKSHLSGLGSAANVAASDRRKKDADARKKAALARMPKINIFKGKQGKGIQSQLARAGIEKKTANKILKALQKDFAEAGYNVMENAARKVIALKNTLQVIGALTDPVEKQKVKEIIVNMLRQNKIKLDPQSSKALRPPADVSELLNATSLKDYVREYNKLVDADARNIRKIDSKVIEIIRDAHGYFEVDELVKVLQGNSFSTFGNPKTLEKFIQLATLNRAQRRAAARGEKGSSKDSAKTPEAIANKRTAAKKKRKAQKQARKKGRPKRKEHIEIDQENTELISESVFKQWQKLIGTI